MLKLFCDVDHLYLPVLPPLIHMPQVEQSGTHQPPSAILRG